MFTQEEKKALLELIARVTGGVKDLGFLLLLASAARKIEAMPVENAGIGAPAVVIEKGGLTHEEIETVQEALKK